MKKILIIVLVALFTVGGSVTGVALYTNQPEYIMQSAISGAIEDFAEREEVAYLFDILDDGSIEFSANDKGLFQGASNEIKTQGKLYFSENGIMLDDFKLSGLDEIKDINADAYIGKDKIYVSNDDILGGAYGLVKGEMAYSFENSIFKPESESSFELSKEQYDLVLATIKANEDVQLTEAGEKLAKKYVKLAWESICEFGEFELTDKDMRFNGEKVSTRVVTLKLDGNAITEILYAMYDYAVEDDDLYDFVYDISEIYGKIDLDGNGKRELIEYYEEYFIDDKNDAVSDYIESFEKLEDEIKITAVTKKLSTTLLKLTVDFVGETMELELGKNGIKYANYITVDVDGDKVEFKLKEDTSDRYEATVKEADGDTLFDIKIDRKRGKYTVTIDDELEIKGDVTVDGKSTTLTVAEIDGEKTDITFIINTNDKMPTPEDDINNIFEVKESDIEKWINKLKKTA